MPTPKTTTFVCTVLYYTPAGQHVRTGVMEANCRVIGRINPGRPDETFVPNMHDAASKVRGLRDSGGPGALPGRPRGPYAEGWDGPIVVTHPLSAVPALVLPG